MCKVKKYIRMGITIFKFSFVEVYRSIYGRKSCFTAPLSRRRKKKSDGISDDIPPKMKNLNTVIP